MENSVPGTVLEIDYIEVDMPQAARKSCASCDNARARLEEAIDRMASSLREIGTRVEVRELKVRTRVEAELLQVRGSPTIRIAGLDFHPEHRGTDGEERVWHWRGGEYSLPPAGMFAEALMAARGAMLQSASYEVPTYLRRYLTEQSPA